MNKLKYPVKYKYTPSYTKKNLFKMFKNEKKN